MDNRLIFLTCSRVQNSVQHFFNITISYFGVVRLNRYPQNFANGHHPDKRSPVANPTVQESFSDNILHRIYFTFWVTYPCCRSAYGRAQRCKLRTLSQSILFKNFFEIRMFRTMPAFWCNSMLVRIRSA